MKPGLFVFDSLTGLSVFVDFRSSVDGVPNVYGCRCGEWVSEGFRLPVVVQELLD